MLSGEVTVRALDDYQEAAFGTAAWTKRDLGIPPLVYCTLSLAGEAGEVSDKVGKLYRDGGGELTPEIIEGLALEIGDVLWYISNLARLLGFNLSEIAAMNISKLADREARGRLGGEGDRR